MHNYTILKLLYVKNGSNSINVVDYNDAYRPTYQYYYMKTNLAILYSNFIHLVFLEIKNSKSLIYQIKIDYLYPIQMYILIGFSRIIQMYH